MPATAPSPAASIQTCASTRRTPSTKCTAGGSGSSGAGTGRHRSSGCSTAASVSAGEAPSGSWSGLVPYAGSHASTQNLMPLVSPLWIRPRCG